MNYKNEATKQTNNPGKLIGISVGIIILVALIAFLFTGEPTGWQVIFNQGAAYILSMFFFFAISLVAIYAAYRVYNKNQETTLGFWAAIVVAVVFIAIAFGKGCTDKANSGVTGPGGAPAAVE